MSTVMSVSVKEIQDPNEESIVEHSTAESPQDGAQKERLSASTLMVLLLVACLPVMFATGLASNEVLRRNLLILGAGIALLSWGLSTVRSRHVELMAGRTLLSGILFGVWALASIAWSAQVLVGSLSGLFFFSLVAISWIVLAPSGRTPRTDEWALAVAMGVLGAGLWGVLDRLGVSLFTIVWDAPGSTGAFGSGEFAAAFYAVALPWCALLLVRALGKMNRAVGVLALLVGTTHFAMVATPILSIILGASALTVGVIAHMAGAPSGRKKLWFVTLVVMISAAVGFLGSKSVPTESRGDAWAVSLPYMDTFGDTTKLDFVRDGKPINPMFATDRTEELKSPQARSYILEVAKLMISERPAEGHGAGGWWLVQTRHAPSHPFTQKMFDTYPAFRSPHNMLLKVTVDMGFTGLVLILLWTLSSMYVALRSMRHKHLLEGAQDDALSEHAALLMALMSGLCVAVLTPLLEQAAPAILLVLSMALLARSAHERAPGGWTQPWRLNGAKDQGKAFYMSLFAVLLGASMLAPAAFDLTSSYWRGVGDQMMLHGKYARARSAYHTADGIFSAYAEVSYNIALTYVRTGKTLEARGYLDSAVARHPDDARILNLAAKGHLKLNSAKEAEKLLLYAIEKFPNYISAYKHLGLAKEISNDYKGLVLVFEKALTLNPPAHAKGYFHHELAQVYENVLGQPGKALEHLEKAVDLMEHGNFLRTRVIARIPMLKKRIKRERLIREGKPVPKDLIPEVHKGHDHGHDHGSHTLAPGMQRGLTPIPPSLKKEEPARVEDPSGLAKPEESAKVEDSSGLAKPDEPDEPVGLEEPDEPTEPTEPIEPTEEPDALEDK